MRQAPAKMGIMTKTVRRKTLSSHRWQNWLAVGASVWLLASPELRVAVLSTSHAGGQNDPAIWNAWFTGFLGILIAALGFVVSRPWPSFLMVGLATWLAISPYELGYHHLAFWTWNAMLTACAIWIGEGNILLERYDLLPKWLDEPALEPVRRLVRAVIGG
jgi:hypothetical protein